jgi:hypothetical protein
MSAWFVMSAMGIYPVTPGSGDYVIGSPLFEEVKIKLDNGKDFVISAKNNNAANIYIQSAELNGEKFDKAYLTHEILMKGGALTFDMNDKPGNGWASSPESRPVTAITDYVITPVPFFEALSSSFQDKVNVALRHVDSSAVIHYTNGDLKPDTTSQVYADPFTFEGSVTLNAVAVDKGIQSKTTSARFFQIHNSWTISIKYPCNSQYTAGGDIALIDGQHGGPNFRTGSWQGYQGDDLDAVIDMGKVMKVNKISVTFLQDQRSWIFMPENVEFSAGTSPGNLKSIGTTLNDVPDNLNDAVIKDFKKDGVSIIARYVRVHATNRKTCPSWHSGAGNKAWIFVDEISVE